MELLIIGNEILSGRTLDTNSHWLAQQLGRLGLPVRRITVVPDQVEEIAAAIQASCDRGTRILITSGGLGPTFDDLTAQGLAQAAGAPLELHRKALQMIRNRYRELHAQGLVDSPRLTPPRRKMAQLPRGASFLSNTVGTAPGIFLQLGRTWVFCLPGVPRELKSMFTEEVEPRIASLARVAVLEEVVEVPVRDESALAPIIDKVRSQLEGVYFKSMPCPYQERRCLRVSITATASTHRKARALLERARHALQRAAGKHGNKEGNGILQK